MKNFIKFLPVLFVMTLLSLPAFCAEAASGEMLTEGKALVEKSCSSCHNGELFSKEMRKITSLEKLEAMVEKCAKAAGAEWTGAQKKAVVHYLNDTYYKF